LRTSAVKFIGSSGEWERNGIWYVARTGLAADCIAAATSPCCRMLAAGFPIASARPLNTPSELRFLFGPSSHVTVRASRACFACHQLSATTATPSVMPRMCFTPGIFFAFESSKLATLPPITGHCASAACSIPGSLTSMPNSVLPVILPAVSRRLSGLPT
jgi:hypothetical protein